jgi:hypothetical protein
MNTVDQFVYDQRPADAAGFRDPRPFQTVPEVVDIDFRPPHTSAALRLGRWHVDLAAGTATQLDARRGHTIAPEFTLDESVRQEIIRVVREGRGVIRLTFDGRMVRAE